MASFYILSSQVVDSGADNSGLGRWAWMRWKIPEEKITIIVSEYAPLYSQVVKKNIYIRSTRYIYNKPSTN